MRLFSPFLLLPFAVIIQTTHGQPTIRSVPSIITGPPPPMALATAIDPLVGDCPKPQVAKLVNVTLVYDPNDPSKNSVTIPVFSDKDSECSQCTYQVILFGTANLPQNMYGGAAFLANQTTLVSSTPGTGTCTGTSPASFTKIIDLHYGEDVKLWWNVAGGAGSCQISATITAAVYESFTRGASADCTGCGAGANIGPASSSTAAIGLASLTTSKQSGPVVKKSILPSVLGSPRPRVAVLSLSGDTPSPDLSKPKLLTVEQATPGLEVIRDPAKADTIRQVRGADGLADVVVANDYKYTINFYSSDNVGAKNNGLYQTSGTPVVAVTVQNPDESPTTNNRLNISEVKGGTTNMTQYVYDSSNQDWTVTGADGTTIDRRTITMSNNNTVKTETKEALSSANNTVVGRVVEQSQVYSWGTPVVQTTQAPGTNPLLTSFTYSTNPSDNGYQQLQQIVYPNGNWKCNDFDAYGRPTTTCSPFVNQTVTTDPTLIRQTILNYTPLAGSGDSGTDTNAPRTTVDYLLGWEIARRYLVLKAGEKQDIQCQTPGAAWNAADNLVTITKYYTAGWASNLVQSVQFPDGTLELREYATNSTQRTDTVYRGQPNANFTAVIDGTKTITVSNDAGYTVTSTVLDIASGITLDQQTYSNFDNLKRPLRVTFMDGTIKDTVYGCCGIDSETDRDGVVTTYGYDPLKRKTSETRLGISSLYGYDAAGNLLSVRRQGTDSTVVTIKTLGYDLAGRLVAETNALGGPTFYSELPDSSNTNQTIKSTTYADGGTRIETFARDGSLLKVTGTAARPVRYVYGIEPLNGVYRPFVLEIKLAASGFDTDEWTKTYKDMLGRPFTTLYAGVFPPFPAQQSFYNNKGQLWKQMDPDGVATLYQYNAKGELEYTALDINRNDGIDFTGTDRITRTVSDVLANYGTNVRRTRTYVWTTDNSNTSLLINTAESSVDGLRTWTTTPTGVTQTQTTYNGSASRTMTVTAPEGTSVVSQYQNGRLMSVTRKDSTGAQIGQMSYTYDAHGRQTAITDARTGTTTYAYNNADQVTTVTTPAPAAGQNAQTTTTSFNTMLQGWKVTYADGTSVTNEFFQTGDLKKTSGSRTYPVQYAYDPQGRMKTMTTWQYVVYNMYYTTTWNYDPNRGFLSSKRDPNGYGPDYTYTPAGRMATRLGAAPTSPRPTTTYTYGMGGDLTQYSYNYSGTHGWGFYYDRRGRRTSAYYNPYGAPLETVTFTYNDAGQLLTEANSGGTLGGWVKTNSYDAFGRRTNFTVNTPSLTQYQFSYDNASRLSAVKDGTYSANYSYLANSPLVSQVSFRQGNSVWMTTAKQYDNLNRLTSIASTHAGPAPTSFAYQYNDTNQRTRMTLADGSYWQYQYDGMGQVTSGKRYWSDNVPVAGQQFEYAMSDIGNRTSTKEGGDAAGGGLRTRNYSPNGMNQGWRGLMNSVDILGMADGGTPVTVNGQTAYRKGNYYQSVVAVDSSGGDVNATITVGGGGMSGSGKMYFPGTGAYGGWEASYYDYEGNLTSQGRWGYTWDQENRLVKVESLGNAPVESKRRIELENDWQGRRIKKTVSTTANGTTWTVQTVRKYVYDGWNVVAEMDGNNNLIQSYLWGLDLSGTQQGAGGVGGLLAVKPGNGIASFAAMDGNGNVAGLVTGSAGPSVNGAYEYGPFGEPIRVSGTMGKANPFRWSTKFTDEETDLVYYGYRYYNPSVGRWLNRDPLGENGGINLYGFVRNDPINAVDADGRIPLDTLLDVGFFTYDFVTGAGPATISADIASLVIPYVPNPNLVAKPLTVWRSIKGEVREVSIGRNAGLRETLGIDRNPLGPNPKLTVRFEYKGERSHPFPQNYPKHFRCRSGTEAAALAYTSGHPNESQWRVGFTDARVRVLIDEALKGYLQKYPQPNYSTLNGYVHDFRLPLTGDRFGDGISDALSYVGYSGGNRTTRIKLDVAVGGEIHAYPVP